MAETAETKGMRTDEDLSIFYEPRVIEEYHPVDNDDLLKLAFRLKEKRKDSIEGLLYLSSQENTRNLDQILGGENELEKKERRKYIEYIIQKHRKWLPNELTREKLQRRVRKMQTLKPKTDKKEKKDKKTDEQEEEKEDMNLRDSDGEILEEEEAEEFEDLDDLDQGDMSDRFEDNDDMRGNDRDGGDGDYD